MRLDQFSEFMMPADVRSLVEQYRSPESESSIVKGVPLEKLDLARRVMRVIAGLTGQRLRVIYRGPRRDSMRCWCRREDARSFAVYFR